MTRTYQIFGLAGQSNAGGTNSGGAPTPINGWGNVTSTRVQFLSLDKSCAHAFANEYNKIQDSYTPIIELEFGSGVSVTTNTTPNWSASGTLRANIKTKLDEAVTVTGATVKGIIWIQGEADAGLIDAATITKSEYKTALADVFDYFAAQYSGVKIFIVRTGREDPDTSGYQDVRAAQDELASERSDTIMAYTGTVDFWDLGLIEDTVHYSQAGQNIIGKAVALSVKNNL